MATCLNCGKSSIFLKVDSKRLCEKCKKEILNQVYLDQINLDTTNFLINDPASAFDLFRSISDQKETLFKYKAMEDKGIFIIDPTATSMLKDLDDNNDDAFRQVYQTDFDNLAVVIANMKILKHKRIRVEKFITQLEAGCIYFHDPTKMDAIKTKANNLLKTLL